MAAPYCDGVSSVDQLVDVMLSDGRIIEADLPKLGDDEQLQASMQLEEYQARIHTHQQANTVRGSAHCIVS